MKILSAHQIKECDAFTIKREGISSFALMERAATACLEWIRSNYSNSTPFIVLCGMGNNGGDGLALTRLLIQEGFDASAIIIQHSSEFSKDAAENLRLLQALSPERVTTLKDDISLLAVPKEATIIDAILGTGLSRKVEGLIAACIISVNQFSNKKIAIDIPSGLYADAVADDQQTILKADDTLTFEFTKRSFLHEESAIYTGTVHVLPIGLSEIFVQDCKTLNNTIEKKLLRTVYKKRSSFTHKGTYGSAMLVGGSYGKIGSIALSTLAALRTGAGLVYTQAPDCGYDVLQTLAPEAMFIASGKEFVEHIIVEDNKPTTIGIGPGMGLQPSTVAAFQRFLETSEKPMVIDADALNILSKNRYLLSLVPKDSVLTPHPKEFERLFGKASNSLKQVELARAKAIELGIFIILKRNHTAVLTPQGVCYYNTSGNPGMATGGSGDVLTGILTSLIAQKYTPEEACLLGVYLHGRAGDIAAQKLSQEAMLASDIIKNLGEVFKELKQL